MLEDVSFELSKKQIDEEVISLASQIDSVYEGNDNLVIMGILDGAARLVKDLLANMGPRNLGLGWLDIKTYDGTSQGVPKLKSEEIPKRGLKGRDVLVVDDILDSGKTLFFVKRHLAQYEPKTLRTLVLMDKVREDRFRLVPDFVGFTIPDVFVVGYGLDYDGKYRNQDHISALPEEER
jgi:hypoxanthine phosphoribosyltransferase